MTGLGHIDSVFHEDDRIVIGVGDTLATQFQGGPSDGLRRRLISQGIDFARLADIPVLTELTGKITACRAKGEDRCAGQVMIERFLFDGVHAIATRAAIGSQNNASAVVGSHEAHTLLAFVQLTGPRANIALNSAIIEGMPIFGWKIGIHITSHLRSAYAYKLSTKFRELPGISSLSANLLVFSP